MRGDFYTTCYSIIHCFVMLLTMQNCSNIYRHRSVRLYRGRLNHYFTTPHKKASHTHNIVTNAGNPSVSISNNQKISIEEGGNFLDMYSHFFIFLENFLLCILYQDYSSLQNSAWLPSKFVVSSQDCLNCKLLPNYLENLLHSRKTVQGTNCQEDYTENLLLRIKIVQVSKCC